MDTVVVHAGNTGAVMRRGRHQRGEVRQEENASNWSLVATNFSQRSASLEQCQRSIEA